MSNNGENLTRVYVGKGLLQVARALELGLKMGMIASGPSLYGYKANPDSCTDLPKTSFLEMLCIVTYREFNIRLFAL